MSKTRVAILGGGFGGLTAAYELTRTAALRDRFAVTLYQQGWRLGGKCASARDAQGRILEHGLHFWFGCYDNAWAMLREVYEAWDKPPGCPFRTGLDAFTAQSFTPIGQKIGDRWSYFPLRWPTNSDRRGEGQVALSLRGMLTELVRLLHLVGGTALAARPAATPTGHAGLAEDAQAFLAGARTLGGELESALHRVAAAATDDLELLAGLEQLRDHGRTLPQALLDRAPGGHLVRDALHVGAAFARGLLVDVILRGHSLDALDQEEFRAWLIGHGGDPALIAETSLVRAIYDCCFWYEDGDVTRPSVGAGTAIRVILRIVTTYKEAVMFTLEAGMAEAVVAPLHEVLLARGVEFRFFHRARSLQLDDSGTQIARILLDRQAEVLGGAYRPTKVIDGLVTWPAEPFWDQLRDGDRLRREGVNFESAWCPEPPVGQATLEAGRDFDHVVLGVSLGAFKPLAAGVPGMCDELIAASPRFAAMAHGIGIVPTFAAQVWCGPTMAELGWPGDPPATVAGPEPLPVWADMSQLLPRESGHAPGGRRPGSLHYLCGTLGTALYARPPGETGTPALALAMAERHAAAYLRDFGTVLWPGSAGLGGPEAAVADRYVRANVDPTECCPGSAAGEVPLRLKSDETGFTNLALAGCYVRTGLNSTCVEAAVMSGMMAARAISGSPREILGEHFL